MIMLSLGKRALFLVSCCRQHGPPYFKPWRTSVLETSSVLCCDPRHSSLGYVRPGCASYRSSIRKDVLESHAVQRTVAQHRTLPERCVQATPAKVQPYLRLMRADKPIGKPVEVRLHIILRLSRYTQKATIVEVK